MKKMFIKVLIVSVLIIISSIVNGIKNDDHGVLRKVVCNEGFNSFKNVKCVQETDKDAIVIGLHNIMFGYLNGSVNCSETEETKGCEEVMSKIQTPIMLDKGSAQVAMNAVQFPSVGAPDNCKGYDHKLPDYMAFNFECLKTSSITEMCTYSIKSGQKLSVYNNGYPAIRPVSGTHHCECKITSPSPVIYITLYDYRLNCTGNQQNMTIEDEHGTVLAPVCDSFRNGQYNSSNQNLTMVWQGQINRIGLFWVGFQDAALKVGSLTSFPLINSSVSFRQNVASDPMSNVTVNCYQIWDPTTTTTTTTTSTTTTTTTTAASTTISSSTATLSLLNSIVTNTSMSQKGVTRSTDSVVVRSTQSSAATSTQKMNNTELQKRAMPKTVIYALSGGGGGLFLLVVICVVVFRRRNKVTETDHMRMTTSKDRNTTKSSGPNTARDSTKSQDYVNTNRRTSSEIELDQRDDKGRRVSSAAMDKYDGKRTSGRIQEQAVRH